MSRINHSYLGEGEVVRTLPEIGGLVVKFDNTPPKKYNQGTNPCLVLKEDVEEIKEELHEQT